MTTNPHTARTDETVWAFSQNDGSAHLITSIITSHMWLHLKRHARLNLEHIIELMPFFFIRIALSSDGATMYRAIQAAEPHRAQGLLAGSSMDPETCEI